MSYITVFNRLEPGQGLILSSSMVLPFMMYRGLTPFVYFWAEDKNASFMQVAWEFSGAEFGIMTTFVCYTFLKGRTMRTNVFTACLWGLMWSLLNANGFPGHMVGGIWFLCRMQQSFAVSSMWMCVLGTIVKWGRGAKKEAFFIWVAMAWMGSALGYPFVSTMLDIVGTPDHIFYMFCLMWIACAIIVYFTVPNAYYGEFDSENTECCEGCGLLTFEIFRSVRDVCCNMREFLLLLAIFGLAACYNMYLMGVGWYLADTLHADAVAIGTATLCIFAGGATSFAISAWVANLRIHPVLWCQLGAAMMLIGFTINTLQATSLAQAGLVMFFVGFGIQLVFVHGCRLSLMFGPEWLEKRGGFPLFGYLISFGLGGVVGDVMTPYIVAQRGYESLTLDIVGSCCVWVAILLVLGCMAGASLNEEEEFGVVDD